MKKIAFLFALVALIVATSVVAPSVGVSQTKYILAKGAKGVDSLVGAQTKYYTMTPQTSWYKTAIQVYVTRSVVTGTDSTQITFEGSIDNSVWYKLDVGTPVISGGASWYITPKYLSVQANGGALYATPADITVPYVRMKVQHFKAGCNVYVKAWVYLKSPS